MHAARCSQMLADLFNGGATADIGKHHIQKKTLPNEDVCPWLALEVERLYIYSSRLVAQVFPQEMADSMLPWTFPIVCTHLVINQPICNPSSLLSQRNKAVKKHFGRLSIQKVAMAQCRFY